MTATGALPRWRIGVVAVTALLLATAACAADPWRWSDVPRIVVLADIHGAYPAMVKLLKRTGVVDDSLAWSGGATHLVSLGDLLDRGPASREVMDLLIRLQAEASASGGRVHVVAGNHELMNLIGDLRYVAREEFAAFADSEPEQARNGALERFRTQTEFADEQELLAAFDKKYPLGYFGHRAAFAEDGRYGQWLLSLPVVISINDIIFVHGGLPPIAAERTLDEINQDFRTTVSQYLERWQRLIELGILPEDSNRDAAARASAAAENASPSVCVQERLLACEQVMDVADDGSASWDPAVLSLLHEFIELSEAPILGTDGPLWYRGAVYCPRILERPVLDAALAHQGATRVVVGHTVTSDRKAHLIHDGKLLMLDTGMLVAHYRGRPAALIIEDGTSVLQYLEPDERQAPIVERRHLDYNMSREDLEQALNEATAIVTSKENGTTWTVELSFGEQTLSADFYPRGRSKAARNELAAHAIDGLLGLELVPLTVERTVEGTEGALQLRYRDAISEAERQARGLGFGGWCSIQDQLQLMYAWDLLLANPSRSFENLKFRRALWSLHLTDHAAAFATAKRLPKAAAGAISLAPGVRNALAALDAERLEAAVGTWLSKRQMRALLARRDHMLELF